MAEVVTCAACGAERPAKVGRCPSCLLRLGLVDSDSAGLDRIGRYKVLGRLGVGGMGEVYRAHDDRLDREVALKVLPETLAADPERIARFQREARVAASLNHPNIAAIYGFEETDGLHVLVMELVEGVTLAERLREGRLRVEEALSLARQIAEGLEAAHGRGVVHRDLKPSNVKTTPGGQAKILDFGLAKALGDEAPDQPPPAMALTMQYTLPGVVLGTLPYMSPEQARGRPVDRRSDIWSFGCVLYECLAGRRAFDGETPSDVVAKLLEREPDWQALPAPTPRRVRELLERCLVRDPKRRLRDIGDARLELEWALEHREWSSSAAARAALLRAPRAKASLPWLLAAAMTAMATWALVGSAWRGPSEDSIRIRRPGVPLLVSVADPEVPYINVTDILSLAISPDGTTIVYRGKRPKDGPEGINLFIRRADTIQPRRVEVPPGRRGSDTQEATISPDGKWLCFVNQGLYKEPLAGGPPVLIAPSLGVVKGVAWGPGGLVLSPTASSGLVLVSEEGGPLETLTIPDRSRGEVSHRWPDALPDGRHVLFTIKTKTLATFDDAQIALLDLKTKKWSVILRGGSFARWLPTGHIVFARDGRILGAPFALDAGRITGPAVTLAEGVMTEPGSGAAQFAIAREAGALLYVPGGPDVPRKEIVWVDRKGAVTPTGAPAQFYDLITPSPDGTRVAATVSGATDAIFVYDFSRRELKRLTFEGNCEGAHWTLDGKSIAFVSDRDGELGAYIIDADGSGKPRPLPGLFGARAPLPRVVPVRLKDGTGFLYGKEGEVWLARLDGHGEPERINEPQFPAWNASVSHDGRWLVYDSEVSGRSEVYIRPFPWGNGRWQISDGGGIEAHWSPRDDEIIYCWVTDDGKQRLMSVRVSAARGDFSTGRPLELFVTPPDVAIAGFAPDGTRFMGIRSLAPPFPGNRVQLFLNWFDKVAALAQEGSNG